MWTPTLEFAVAINEGSHGLNMTPWKGVLNFATQSKSTNNAGKFFIKILIFKKYRYISIHGYTPAFDSRIS